MTASLSREQKEALKAALKRRLQELRDDVGKELLQSDNERYSELAGGAPDKGDESIADLLSDLNLAVIDHHLQEIREVESALRHLADDTYGRCSDCQGEIGYSRLSAYPTAIRCHACQDRFEKTFVQPGRARL
jgi:RNA polymerase-binding protein DksA